MVAYKYTKLQAYIQWRIWTPATGCWESSWRIHLFADNTPDNYACGILYGVCKRFKKKNSKSSRTHKTTTNILQALECLSNIPHSYERRWIVVLEYPMEDGFYLNRTVRKPLLRAIMNFGKWKVEMQYVMPQKKNSWC